METPNAAGWIFEPGAIARVLGELGFAAELTGHFERQARGLAARPSARAEFLEIAGPWVEGASPASPDRGRDFHALVAVAGLPRMMARHRARGLPPAITAATARDLERRMRQTREKSGRWEFTRLDWFSHHLHRGLLEIGRLQFVPARYALPYRIYTGGDRAVRAFPEAGLPCSAAGWIEEGPGFFTTFREDNDAIRGHPVDLATGRILDRPVRLARRDFQLRLARTMPVLDIHVPSGTGLTREACAASRQEAAAVFAAHFPEIAWEAFVCTSWLLDRELWKCLPADSNIVAFAAMFHPLALPHATARQLFERVFDGEEDAGSLPAHTRLQKSIRRHLENGGTFRETSGVILRG